MKCVIAMAIGLVCLAGCGSEHPLKNPGPNRPAPTNNMAQVQPGPHRVNGPGFPSPSTFSGRKRQGKSKSLAPGAQVPDGPPLLDPPSKRLPPGIVAANRTGTPPDRSLLVDSTEELSFDAQRVFLGEIVKHTFRVKNSSAEVRTIQQDADILPNCGCAAMIPQERTLPPGAEVDVRVSVRTGGPLRKQGPFAHGGKIIWTAASGLRHVTSLTIRGEALGALASNPQVLVFQPEEVKRGAVKDLIFTANAPLDWNTWKLDSTSPNFQIVEQTAPKDGAPASCKVKCLPPECLENFHGEIRVQAQAQLTGSDRQPIAFAVPVRARQAVDLTISPPVAPVVFARPLDRATVKLLFRGDLVTRDQLRVEAIDFPNCQATWKLTKSAEAPTALLEITLVRQPEKLEAAEKKPAGPDPALVIYLAGRKPIAVPAVVVGPSLDAP